MSLPQEIQGSGLRYCGSQGISGDSLPCLRDHECGKKKYPEGIRSRDCPYRGRKGHERGRLKRREQLAGEIPGAFIPGQFVNPANSAAHRSSTGPEIWEDTEGKVDIFVAGVGTGGTLTGVGEYLKAKNPQIRIVACRTFGFSCTLEGKVAALTSFRESAQALYLRVLNTDILIDEIIQIRSEEAYAASKLLAKKKARTGRNSLPSGGVLQ